MDSYFVPFQAYIFNILNSMLSSRIAHLFSFRGSLLWLIKYSLSLILFQFPELADNLFNTSR